jgi:hypothetical protein
VVREGGDIRLLGTGRPWREKRRTLLELIKEYHLHFPLVNTKYLYFVVLANISHFPNEGKGKITLRVRGWRGSEVQKMIAVDNIEPPPESALLPEYVDPYFPLKLSD